MTRPDITVVIPTVSGREDHLARALAAYEANTTATFEVLTFRNLPGVAFGWQRGAEKARGRYIQLANDDNEPRPGWDTAAMACVDRGVQPAPRVFDATGAMWDGVVPEQDPSRLPDGAEVPMSSVPFIARRWWKHITPLPPGMHYFADNWVGWRLSLVGIPTQVCHGYDIVHTWAQPHRGAGWSESERMHVDQQYAGLASTLIRRGAAALAAHDD